MKNLSRWANRHAPLAISLIVFGEFANGFNGVLLGAACLEGLSTASLHTGIALLMGLAMGIRLLVRTGAGGLRIRRWCVFGAFFGNFLLFGLLGGLMAPRPQTQNQPGSVWGNRRVEIRSDALVRPDTLRPVQSSVAVTRANSDQQAGKRVGYALLFVLGIFLTLCMTGLACNIACSGYGLLALVVFLLGLGFTAGGIYFLGRAADKQMTKRSDMTPAERRRTGRRFWLSWAVLAGLFTLLLLISAVSG